jgi:fructose-1,6-bisphosphatase/sedoheptulose 1,7-bisphosphatase-like protein
LCKSENAIFAASGVCDGYLPAAILGEKHTTTFGEVIDVESGTVRRIETTRNV